MLCDLRGSGIEDLVKSLVKTIVGNFMPAVDYGDVFRRESISDDLLKDFRAAGGFAACLYYSGISRGD